jgi:hypothetical protein
LTADSTNAVEIEHLERWLEVDAIAVTAPV